jgi:hypothetical protein
LFGIDPIERGGVGLTGTAAELPVKHGRHITQEVVLPWLRNTSPVPSSHERAAELIAGFCASRESVDTVLVDNSCARGLATAQSDLELVERGSYDESEAL